MKNEPALLVHEGRLLPDAMRRERVASLADVDRVVLETNGRLSVLPWARGALARVGS